MKAPQLSQHHPSHPSYPFDQSCPPGRWASRPLHTSATDFFAAIRSTIPVSLIATPRAQLKCERHQRWEDAKTNPDLGDFDQVPLTNDQGVIVAVFVRGHGPLELREDMLMAADAPLLSFIESADQRPFCFLLADCTISGMVTLSDVQKLPVYSILFSLLIAVEMLLMEWIRKKCGADDQAWMKHLWKNQRGSIEKYLEKAHESNLAIDRLYHATLGQEIQAALGLGLFANNPHEHAKLKSLEELRNRICHAAEVAPNISEARKIPCCVRDAQDIAAWLHEQIQQNTI